MRKAVPYYLLLTYSISAFFMFSSWNSEIIDCYLFTCLQILVSIIFFALFIFIKVNLFKNNRVMYLKRNQPLYLEINREDNLYIISIIVFTIIGFSLPKYLNKNYDSNIISKQIYKVSSKGVHDFTSTARGDYLILVNLKTKKTKRYYTETSKFKVNDELKLIKKSGFLGFDYFEMIKLETNDNI